HPPGEGAVVPAAQPAGARGDQHGDPGLGRRPDQGGDAEHLPAAAERRAAVTDAAADPRRTGLRGAARRTGRGRRPCPHGDDAGAGRPAAGAVEGRSGGGAELAGPGGIPPRMTRMGKEKTMQLTAVFIEVPEGYVAFVEELPGANTQGDTLEEARENLQE